MEADRRDEVLKRLEAQYGTQALKPCADHLKQLILTILSHRTTRQDENQAFQAMWARYGSWHAIQHADVTELTATLQATRYPERKAPYIQGTLRAIHEQHSAYNIDFLRDLATDDAMDWLQSLPGVGPKTASLVMLFCFHRPVLPVDTHVHRVSTRLGILEKTSAQRAHKLLLSRLPNDAEYLFTYHRLFFKLGQQVCTYHNPRCNRCKLTDLCPSAFRVT